MENLEDKSKSIDGNSESTPTKQKERDSYMQGSFDATHGMGYFPFGVKSVIKYTLGFIRQKLPSIRNASSIDLTGMSP